MDSERFLKEAYGRAALLARSAEIDAALGSGLGRGGWMSYDFRKDRGRCAQREV
jgi:hypothetical protein